ncbi:MAG: putative hydrolase of the alpha/beta superfamily [uncultured archaeon A07HR67]|nr:MAG: putative hydrolase of the alpha/beta superfamily [uncultured archaeon A07HR67]
MSDTVLIPGGREVRAALDTATGTDTDDPTDADADPTAAVVACPPDPRHGGRRSDARLVAVSDAVTAGGVDCLRVGYGEYDEGYGERADADNAVGWALDRYDRVGLFGFSFGGAIALVAGAERPALRGVCALAPPARLASDLDAVAALDRLADRDLPVRVVCATRDSTVDWEPVAERARELGGDVVSIDADHGFVGRRNDVADAVAEAFDRWLAA